VSQKFEVLAEMIGVRWTGVVVLKRSPKGRAVERRQGGFADSKSALRWAEAQLVDIERQEEKSRRWSTPAPMGGWSCGCIRPNYTYTGMATWPRRRDARPRATHVRQGAPPVRQADPSSRWRREPASDELANRRRKGFGMSNSTGFGMEGDQVIEIAWSGRRDSNPRHQLGRLMRKPMKSILQGQNQFFGPKVRTERVALRQL
jgi:hypothetical protein